MGIIDRASKLTAIEDDFNIVKLIKFIRESVNNINKDKNNRNCYYNNNIHKRLIRRNFTHNKFIK